MRVTDVPDGGRLVIVRLRSHRLLRLVANLAAACTGCHVDASVRPELRVYPAAPADGPTIEARMARHRWAADRMWEGIVVGVDEPWRAGLDVIAAEPPDGQRFRRRC